MLTTSYDAQVDRLVELGYPSLAGMTEDRLRELLEPLRTTAEGLPTEGSASRVPWVLVVSGDLVAPDRTVPLLRLWGARGHGSKAGIVDRNHGPEGLAVFRPTDGSLPPAPAYLLVDVERGEEFRNVAPEEASAGDRVA